MRHSCSLVIRGASVFVLLLYVLAVAVRSNAQATTQGQWSAVATWPTRAVHATLLPDGRVFFVSYYAESLQPHVWDPGSNTFTTTAASSYALFCAGHTPLADGRVLIVGGHIADYTGYPHAVIYNPATNGLSSLPDMNTGRWYPTATTLPNGDVLVVSGDINSNTNVDTLPQVFQLSTHTWRNLTSAQLALPLYPSMMVAPNGKVFNAGPSRQSRYLDASGTGAWSNVAVTNFTGSRDYGPAVMYDAGKVAVFGGADPPTATAEVIDLNAATPAWKFTGSMHFPRRQHNAVVLPDGKVFIVGGSSAGGFDTSTSPVLPTEMWDPATGQFTVMASIAMYRGYHSTALLLPDGRVLSAGGNVGGPNAQLFSPPYLFAGARPAIASAPASAGYGQTVFVGTPDAASISSVTLLREASVTHTNNMSRGFSRLSFTKTSTGLNVTMPANANLAPPGYYMLFILNSAGVPSVGSIIQISSSAASVGTVTGKVTNTSGAPILGASVTLGGNGAVTGADGAYTLQAPAGSATLTAALAGYQSASETVTRYRGNNHPGRDLAACAGESRERDRPRCRQRWRGACRSRGECRRFEHAQRSRRQLCSEQFARGANHDCGFAQRVSVRIGNRDSGCSGHHGSAHHHSCFRQRGHHRNGEEFFRRGDRRRVGWIRRGHRHYQCVRRVHARGRSGGDRAVGGLSQRIPERYAERDCERRSHGHRQFHARGGDRRRNRNRQSDQRLQRRDPCRGHGELERRIDHQQCQRNLYADQRRCRKPEHHGHQDRLSDPHQRGDGDRQARPALSIFNSPPRERSA